MPRSIFVPELFSNYRPIALFNAFYQLVNLIITSRLTGMVERYLVLESSQSGFRNYRAVQLVIQKANWLIQEGCTEEQWHTDTGRPRLEKRLYLRRPLVCVDDTGGVQGSGCLDAQEHL